MLPRDARGAYPERAADCFGREQGLPAFLQVIRDSRMPASESMVALSLACAEADPLGKRRAMQDKRGGITEIREKAIGFFVFGLFGEGTAAFSRLRGSETQKEFKKRLERIKAKRDRYERIRDVYALVSEFQGKYDYRALNEFALTRSYLWLTPAETLDSAKDTGYGGICRNFATLLYWSLLQVARPMGSDSMALDESSFSAELMTGPVPLRDGSRGEHAWVRVNLPFRKADGPGLRFESVDLDTTFYPNEFAPLIPRLSGVSAEERAGIMTACERVRRCLFEARIHERSPRRGASQAGDGASGADRAH